MKQKIRCPFAGKPATWQVAERDGSPAFHVRPRVLTPVRAYTASVLTQLGVVAGLGYGLFALASAPNPDEGMLTAALAVPVVGGLVLHRALLSLFRKPVWMKLTAEHFSVKTLFGWKNYDRQLPHRFALVAHDWTQAERDQAEYQAAQAQLQKRVIRKQRWFANSFHLSFDYLGQRNDIVTIYGQKEAAAIATRLKACDDVLDAFARRGHGTPLAPEDEWGDQPGEIPETV
jgi:hypothetical protein